MKKVFVLGQAKPRREADRPFGTTALYKWFSEVAISDATIANSFAFNALVNYFPGSKKGSHLVPTPTQIKAARPELLNEIRSFNPDILVPVGTLAIREVLCDPTILLSQAVGSTFTVDPFHSLGYDVLVIPLPHPSGASPWTHIHNNQAQLKQALALLKKAIIDF